LSILEEFKKDLKKIEELCNTILNEGEDPFWQIMRTPISFIKKIQNGRFNEALQVAKEAFQLYPENLIVLDTMAEAYVFTGQEEKALQLFEKSYKLEKNSHTLNWIKKVKFEIRKRKLYNSFCDFQNNYKKNNYSLNDLKEHLNTLNRINFNNPTMKDHIQFLSKLHQIELYKFIPFSIHIYIRIHVILKGIDNRLVYVQEITKFNEQVNLIIFIIKDMIKQKEINAKYFEKAQAFFFTNRPKNGDIMKVMIKYRDKR